MFRRFISLFSAEMPFSEYSFLQAIGRLTTREAYDRIYRFRLASHASVLHKDLPKEQWVKPEEVCLLLTSARSTIERRPVLSRTFDTLPPTSRRSTKKTKNAPSGITSSFNANKPTFRIFERATHEILEYTRLLPCMH